MKYLRFACWILIANLCIVPLLWAGAFDPIGSGARAQGMGNAYTAMAEDPSALYWNPAGLGGVRRSSVEFTHLDVQTLGLLSFDQLIYAQPFVFNNTVAIGLTHLGTTANVTFLDYSEDTFTLAYQQSLFQDFSAGLNLKFFQAHYDQSGGGFGIDLGVRYQIVTELALGLMAENVNQPGIYWVTDNVDFLPINLRFGMAGYILPSLTVVLDVDCLLDSNPQTHFGAEWRLFRSMLALRAGVTHLSYENRFLPSVGVGFRFSYLEFSYAYASHYDLNGNHVLSLQWGF